MDKQSIIDIKNLKKQYPESGILAINNLNLFIPRGSFYGLLGPNGAGKTSAISIICGLLKADEGEVLINTYSFNQNKEDIKKSIGFVPQDIALYQELTVKENLIFFGKLYKIKSKDLNIRINELIRTMKLRSNSLVKHLSGGMKRRVNIIVGLLHQPQILILDEPTVGIDVQSKQIILNYIKQLNNEGMTVLYTSHLIEEAEEMCDIVSVIDEGKVIEEGSPKLLLQKYRKRTLKDVFIMLTNKEEEK